MKNQNKLGILTLIILIGILVNLQIVSAGACTDNNGQCEWSPCSSGTSSIGKLDCGILHSCCVEDFTCNDPDGSDVYKKTTVITTAYGQEFQDTDYCSSSNQVAEYTCGDSPENLGELTTYSCPYGCNDGACKTTPNGNGGCTPEGKYCGESDIVCCEGLVCNDDIFPICEPSNGGNGGLDIKTILLIIGGSLIGAGIVKSMKGGKK